MTTLRLVTDSSWPAGTESVMDPVFDHVPGRDRHRAVRLPDYVSQIADVVTLATPVYMTLRAFLSERKQQRRTVEISVDFVVAGQHEETRTFDESVGPDDIQRMLEEVWQGDAIEIEIRFDCG